MSQTALRHTLLTLLWVLSIAVFFRWWGTTLRSPGLLLWTLFYLALYLATAFTIYGRGIRTRHREVWRPAVLWTTLVLVVLGAHAVLPQIHLRGQAVQTVAFVSVMDVVFPCWIMVRVVGLLWEPILVRVSVLTLGPVIILSGMFAYMIPMPGASHAGPLPPLSPDQESLRDRLATHVHVLASEIGERNNRTYGALQRAATFVEDELAAVGYTVTPQYYDVGGRPFHNMEVVLPGVQRPDEIIVVGGHYDSAEGTPGANDNASGTAALLELARLLHQEQFARTIRFVAFVNEEPPYFNTEGMGSWQYAARAAERGERVVAMVSLETVGYFRTEPESQRYPPLFDLFYPDRGDFIAFVGNLASRSLVRRAIAVFRRTTRFPSQGVAAPPQVPGVTWSCHSAFWIHGFKAIMITDTAPFRYPHYHQLTDTVDRLDYERMARVVEGVAEVIRHLAGPVERSQAQSTQHGPRWHPNAGSTSSVREPEGLAPRYRRSMSASEAPRWR